MQIFVGRPSSPEPKKVKHSEISFLDPPTKMLGQSGPTHWVGWVTQSAIWVCYRHNPDHNCGYGAASSSSISRLVRALPLPSTSVDLLRAPALLTSLIFRRSPSYSNNGVVFLLVSTWPVCSLALCPNSSGGTSVCSHHPQPLSVLPSEPCQRRSVLVEGE
jgi:hypothetical protein